MTTATITGLAAGTYTLSVIDDLGCSAEGSYTLAQPDAIELTITNVHNVSCFGGYDGRATVEVEGGSAPYTYHWRPSGQTTATAIGLSAGTYTVTVTDANGCSEEASVTIEDANALIPGSIASTGEVICKGENASTITSQQDATGQGTIEYRWLMNGEVLPSSNDATFTPHNLSAGTFVFTREVKDDCVDWTLSEGSWTVEVNETPVVAISGDLHIQPGHSTTLTASGATTYLWSNGATTSSITVTLMETTTFTVTGTDANGCSSTDEVTVLVDALGVGDSFMPDVQVYPNPTKGAVAIECEGMTSITVMSSIGQVISTMSLEQPADRYDLDFSTMTPGVYMVRISTSYGQSVHRITVCR